MEIKQFNKLIETNPNIDYCISTIIGEYDIKSAHTTACYFIFGKEMYDKLMSMDKLSRNTHIGKMMRDDPTLHPKISSLLLKWFNCFCEENNIKENDFISSTRDSLLLVNKKPIKTKFENGLVEFRNKDGEFTSYIRFKEKNMEILFDSMSNSVRIKGVNQESVDNNKVFIKLFKQLLNLLEESKYKQGNLSCLKKISNIRLKYIDSKDKTMYASIERNNRFIYIIDGQRTESEVILEENENIVLSKYDNFTTFILPLIKIYFKRH